jgi:serine/threonine-protein kinase
MGAVVAARHVDLDELRAIKFMKPEMRTNAQAEQRFMREARAAAKLKSDHVARVHDIGRFETGEPYMVIEYLDGQDLKAVLKSMGPLDPELAVVFILQACEALAEAHAAGIVHRDLKPSNLFVIEGTDGRLKIKLLDFGISKLTGALAEQAGMDLTHTSAIMGSPLYMSPEQMASTRDIDARTGVWSLGVSFYQLVTGKRPFRGKTVTAVTISVTTDVPKAPIELRPDIPEQLNDVILGCLAKDPDDRYASVADLASDLSLLAPAHARGLIDKIERVAARSASASGRFTAATS